MGEIDKIFKTIDTDDLKKKIVEELFSLDNLFAKTELKKPMNFTVLKAMEDMLEENKMKYAASILAKFRQTFFQYMISKDRQGRKEYIEAFNALTQYSFEQDGSKSELPKV